MRQSEDPGVAHKRLAINKLNRLRWQSHPVESVTVLLLRGQLAILRWQSHPVESVTVLLLRGQLAILRWQSHPVESVTVLLLRGQLAILRWQSHPVESVTVLLRWRRLWLRWGAQGCQSCLHERSRTLGNRTY